MAEGPPDSKRPQSGGAPKDVPKPYTVPEGYKAPSMSELWLYANKTHPYYRYGYSLVLGVGLVAGAYALLSKGDEPQQQPNKS